MLTLIFFLASYRALTQCLRPSHRNSSSLQTNLLHLVDLQILLRFLLFKVFLPQEPQRQQEQKIYTFSACPLWFCALPFDFHFCCLRVYKEDGWSSYPSDVERFFRLATRLFTPSLPLGYRRILPIHNIERPRLTGKRQVI